MIRFLGSVALWIAAVLGVVAGGIWIAGQLGWVQPLIVISGSMEPGIGTGDLLISRSAATERVEVGDVVSLPSGLTRKLVTHRVTEATAVGDGMWEIRMKGDANDESDLETYTVGARVWTPMVQIPEGGKVVSKLMDPAVALPILLALFALLGLSLLGDEEDEEDEEDEKHRVALARANAGAASGESARLALGAGFGTTRLLLVPQNSLAELDISLAVLGVDLSMIDGLLAEPHVALPADEPGVLAVDDAADPPRADVRDRRRLVMSG
jgi:signal peptidase I